MQELKLLEMELKIYGRHTLKYDVKKIGGRQHFGWKIERFYENINTIGQ